MTTINDKLKILILEDSVSDAKLVQQALRRDGIEFDSHVVETKENYIVAIHEYKPHIILSDHTLPDFDSSEALDIAKQSNINAPFILVTGSVSEEYAVTMIKNGASDYILKTNLSRLAVAVLSALTQKEDRERLRESEEQFQQTIDQMADGAQIITREWKYLYVNDIIAQQTKTSKEQLIGHTMMERFPGIENTFMFSELRRCMEDRVHIEMENEFTYPDGTRRWYKLKMQPVTPGVLIVSQDITDEKNVILLLESQNARIKMMNAAMDRFLYSVSHEFRTPICNGLGLVNLLRNSANESERAEILDKLQYTITNLDELLQGIGLFSEVTTRDVTVSLTDVGHVFDECLTHVKLLEGREFVSIKLKNEGAGCFHTDKRRLIVVLTNLISNSIKFRDLRKSSFVDVVVAIDAGKVNIEVRDNGIGIREEMIDKVFDVFYTTDASENGRGLGLFMVREIVEKLGGAIRISSQRGQGTSISFTLPNGATGTSESANVDAQTDGKLT